MSVTLLFNRYNLNYMIKIIIPRTMSSEFVTLLNQLSGATLNNLFPRIFPIIRAGIKMIDRKTVYSEYEPLATNHPTRKHMPIPIVKIKFARWVSGLNFEDIK